MTANPRLLNIMVDSCAFDPKHDSETPAAVAIFELSEQEHIDIVIAHSTLKEIDHPNTPERVKSLARNQIFSLDVSLNQAELVALRDIESILAGNGKIESIKQDARHVFEAQKYGRHFITTDKRILSRSAELEKLYGIKIFAPSKYLELIKPQSPVKNDI